MKKSRCIQRLKNFSWNEKIKMNSAAQKVQLVQKDQDVFISSKHSAAMEKSRGIKFLKTFSWKEKMKMDGATQNC